MVRRSVCSFLGAAALASALLGSATALAADPAPDFTLRTIERGESVSLSQYAGKVVLVDFWATWCEPCKKSMPNLQKMSDELGPQGFVVLAVSTDDARSGSQVKPYIKRQGYTFTVPRDPESQVLISYNPTKTLPYSVLIDRDGNKASVHSGYEKGDDEALRAEVEALLALPASASAAPAPAPAETAAPAAEAAPSAAD